jgi:hypothetical protein
MSKRRKTIIGVSATGLLCYFVAYLLSVRTIYPTIKAVGTPFPVYRPCDASIVHAIFAPLQLLDAAYLRPSRWHERVR